METMAKLGSCLKDRIIELWRKKEEGSKIVGFFAGDFVPEELIHASGAIPVGLIHGGSPEAVDASHYAAVRLLCPYSKSVFGYWVLEQPYFRLIDLLVAPITCNHLRRSADMWEYFTGVEVFKLGIPHEHDAPHAVEYYLDALKRLKIRLEELTGKEISSERLAGSIELYNRLRSSLRKISDLRKNDPSPVKGSDFISLNQASYYTDPAAMLKILNSFQKEAENRKPSGETKPRVLLSGPILAMGDNKVTGLIEDSGGEIVIEQIDEGVRFYWENISLQGDLLKNMADKYLKNRVPCAFQGQGTQERFNFIEKQARDFQAQGMIWYQLKFCETYDVESFFLQQNMEKAGIPILKLDSDYDPADRGQFKTRIETFLEIVHKRRSSHAG